MSTATATPTKEIVVDTTNILDVRRRALKAKAIQFTGKNGKEVVAFINTTDDGLDSVGRNGGSYVSIKSQTVPDEKGTVRKGDYLVLDAHGYFVVHTPEDFAKFFLIKG